MVAWHLECDHCGHMVDLHTPKDDDAQNLKDGREAAKKQINDWLFEPDTDSVTNDNSDGQKIF